MPVQAANGLVDYGIFTVQRELTSSTLTTSDVTILNTAGNGGIITDVIISTDATGLAGGTNFVLKVGGRTFFTETVANLGANAVRDLRSASVLGRQANINTNDAITVANTVAVGTGA